MARNVRNKENDELKKADKELGKLDKDDKVVEKKTENNNIEKNKENNNVAKSQDKKIKIIVIAVLIICILFVVFALVYKKSQTKDEIPSINKEEKEVKNAITVTEDTIKIATSNKRIVAVMVSNEKAAWPQAGLQEAYMIYECMIEGGETRFMALFKENAPEKIGPIRSARHYFVHFMQEHDAIYTHFGWSPLAQEAIEQYSVNNINGIYDTYYYREGAGYNNAYTSMDKILKFANDKGYSEVTAYKPIYQYSVDEKYLETDDAEYANDINIVYSNIQSVQYAYNPETKLYLRSMRKTPHVDKTTKEQLAVKNIVILFEEYSNLNDYVGSPRQQLSQVGTGTGYYITNGRYEKITWSKSAKTAKTEIKDSTGKDVVLNDGLTFMQIVPKGNDVTFE